MKITVSILLFTVLALASLSARAQTPVPAPAPTPTPQDVPPVDENDIVRINTNLIQLDVTVTDKEGNVVTDLKPEDFEILVNDNPQTITNFSFISIAPPVVEPAGAAQKAKRDDNQSLVPPVPVRLRPDQVKRTIALVFDDLTITKADSVGRIRQAIRKFIDEQMLPGDLVAIIRTGKSFGTLQQFTSDKRMLRAAVERLHYNLAASTLDLSPIKPAYGPGPEIKPGESGDPNDSHVPYADYQSKLLVNASLESLAYIAQGMRGLPGRKALMLMTNGFPLERRGDPDYRERVREGINRLVDYAHRAGVVINTMDPGGLSTIGTAADLDFGMTSSQISTAMFGGSAKYSGPQEGLIEIAKRGGGFASYNDNNLVEVLKRAINDTGSYYLIGYQPDASIFNPATKKFNSLKVNVKRPGLVVRYRGGFFGVTDSNVRPPVATTPQQQILQALSSPFAANDLSIRFTPLFGNDARAGSFVRALVHLPAKDLTFIITPGGMHQAVFNVVAYTFGDNGNIVDSVGETHTVTLNDRLYQRALKSGLVYSLNVPVKKAGGYQLRVAVRDDKTHRVSAASQFITIPDIKKNRLAVSGISLSSYDPKMIKEGAPSAEGEDEKHPVLTQAALRQFRAGHVLQYAYAIYMARLDPATGRPQLTTQIKLYRDGKEIFAGRETAYDPQGKADMERLVAEGGLQLGGLAEGEYVLQVLVTDTLAEGEHRTTTNWTDFEIVK